MKLFKQKKALLYNGKMSELDIELLKCSVRTIISIYDNYKVDINIKLDEYKNPVRLTLSEGNAPKQSTDKSLLSLDGKTMPVTFHVNKFEPKIDIDLS